MEKIIAKEKHFRIGICSSVILTLLLLLGGCGTTSDVDAVFSSRDTWTIFIYMCGTDLETDDASASADIMEMCGAIPSDHIQIIIETGGTKNWRNDVDESVLQRYQITDGELVWIEDQPLKNMGESQTLSDFLEWGVENYPSRHMGVVLWNHGGGSITGVCFDELFDDDSLTVEEMDDAFSTVTSHSENKFEFIGFDACLMSTLEVADMLSNHANYMIASEETEAWNGWDYRQLFDYLAQKPSATGAQIGKIVCTGVYKRSEYYGEEDLATMAVVDLGKIPEVCEAFDQVSSSLFEFIDQEEDLASLARNISKVENYGGNSHSEGYTNMIDMHHFLENIEAISLEEGHASELKEQTTAAIDKLDEAVLYRIYGASRAHSGGLAMYYPLSVQGSEEIQIFKEICPAPEYYHFVNKMIYGTIEGSLDGYDNSIDYGETLANEKNESTYQQLSDSSIQLEEEPYVSEDGYYTLVIAPDSIDEVQSVYCSLRMDMGDTFIDLGQDNHVNVDWETGEVSDDFYGEWLLLPDKQVLEKNLIEESETYTLFSCPILLNGEKTNLRVKWNNDENTYVVMGAWSGVDTQGYAAKELVEIKAGDVITPVYTSHSWSNESITEKINGEAYTVKENWKVKNGTLQDTYYYYAFELVDVFGKSLYTEFTMFQVEDGEVYYFDD